MDKKLSVIKLMYLRMTLLTSLLANTYIQLHD